MPRDRDDYRAMSDTAIIVVAREEGIDPEMAIALAEKLAKRTFTCGPGHHYGRFRFNHKEPTNA